MHGQALAVCSVSTGLSVLSGGQVRRPGSYPFHLCSPEAFILSVRALFFFCIGFTLWSLTLPVIAQGPSKVVIEAVRKTAFHDPINALGTLRANESVRLTVNVAETVTAIHFTDGQRVTRGSLLVEMTSAEEQALLEEAESNLNEAKVQYDRVKQLAAVGTASESLLDERQRDYQAAKARMQGIRSRLKDRIVVAPFDGVLGLRQISVGSLIEPGEVITTLNDDSKMKLDFSVPATYLASLHTGLPVIATSAAYGDQVFYGEVSSIDNQIDPVTRSLTLRAVLDNKQHLLKQGMLMQVTVQKNPRQTLVIRESALVSRGHQHFVWLAIEGERGLVAEQREVSIGARRKGEVEILSGLEEGAQLITEGALKLREGAQVMPVEKLGRQA